MAKTSEKKIKESPKKNFEEMMSLQNSDNLAMQLVSAQMNGENYLSWSKSIIIALRAKDKLSFIDGKIKPLKLDFGNFKKWQKADSMVISWILNSLTKELAGSFIYNPFAKIL